MCGLLTDPTIKSNPFSKDPVLAALSTCLWALQRVIEIMSESGIVLEPSSAREASQSLHVHLQSYAWLALHYHDQKIMFFKVRPKTHYLYHMANEIEALRLNFALFWTFDEESFLGKVKSIAVQTHGKTMTHRVFQRYLLFVGMCLHTYRRKMSA